MDKDTIKKMLYKTKPTAIKTAFKGDYFHYVAQLEGKIIAQFHVDKIEGADFSNEMPAQLLIRWLK